MAPSVLPPDEFELLGRRPESSDDDDYDDAASDSLILSEASQSRRGRLPRSWLSSLLPSSSRPRTRTSTAYSRQPRACLRRRGVRHLCYLIAAVVGVVLALVVFVATFNPSYTDPPIHYHELRARASETGRANPNNETIFIAANIIDEDLIRGAWGRAVLDLIGLLGEENVFLSIYENDSGPRTTDALRDLEQKVKCNSSIVSEHLPLEDIPTVPLPSGERRIKRVAYLAEVRNRALRPLDPVDSPAARSFNQHNRADATFDKILFLNDVVFSPLEAAQLLLSTNIGDDGRTNYRAACAIDFINAFKFYDTFASRDIEGYSMGVPFFPWFTTAGLGQSRQDVLEGKDAVRVRSCWGGMVAFEAKWFQTLPLNASAPSEPIPSAEGRRAAVDASQSTATSAGEAAALPIRFRSEPDTFWDASECCLVHADLQATRDPSDPVAETGIYVNPFVRVAYDTTSFTWLATTRRWERLYSLPHFLVNEIVGLPWWNARRTEVEGEEVTERVWVFDEAPPQGVAWTAADAEKMKGSFQTVKRVATRGGFCGTRKLLVLKEKPKEGEKMWEALPVPPD
ncbi:MAG: hypothetical protein M1832_000201 [Thelocarpon impressellum]|nr:MAG: hypothetical protein M1832_000201 [Thelocarpon impressellum]